MADDQTPNRDHLRARLTEITTRLGELEPINTRGELTGEQLAEFDGLVAEFDAGHEQLRSLDRQAELDRIRGLATSTAAPRRGRPIVDGGGSGDGFDRDPLRDPRDVGTRSGVADPWDTSTMALWGRDPSSIGGEYHSRALDAVERMSGTTDSVRSAATHILETYDSRDGKLARMALALSNPDYVSAWGELAMSSGRAALSDDQARAMNEVRTMARALSLTDAEGGYLVPFQLDPTIILTADGSSNDIRQAARTVVATGDVWNGVSSGGVTWRWSAEASESEDNAPTLGQPSIPVHKADGFIPISVEALADASNIAAAVAADLAFGKDTLEATAFATGTGSNQPTGLVTALTAASPSVTVASATTDTFALGDIYALDSALPERYLGNASWIANRAVYNLTRQFDTAGGAALWAQLREGQPGTLLDHRVLRAEAMDGSVTAAADNYLLALGWFQAYVIADRVGMTIDFVPQLFGANQRPTGQRGWYAYYRVGADSVNDGAFRILNVT